MVGGQQRQAAVARQIDHRQLARRAIDRRQGIGQAGVPHLLAGPLFIVGDQHAEHFTLQGAERRAGRIKNLVQLLAAIEPDALEAAVQRLGVLQQAHDAFNVVGVDVGDDEQLEMTLIGRQLQDALAQRRVGVGRTAVDEYAPGLLGAAIFNPQTIAMRGGQHLDTEHESSPGKVSRVADRHSRRQAPFGITKRNQAQRHQVATPEHATAHAAHDRAEVGLCIFHGHELSDQFPRQRRRMAAEDLCQGAKHDGRVLLLDELRHLNVPGLGLARGLAAQQQHDRPGIAAIQIHILPVDLPTA